MDHDIEDIKPITPDTEPVMADPRKSQFGVLFFFLFLLGILFMGGTYFFIKSQKTLSPKNEVQIKNTVVESDKDLHDMESDVEKLQSKDIDADLTEVDQELKNL